MAFGFPPRHRYSFSFEKDDSLVVLAKATDTAALLDWEISFINETGFIAHSKFSMSSWSEQINLSIDGNQVTIVSSCTGSQIFDWGKNKRNIEKFIACFKEVGLINGQDQLTEKIDLLKTRFSSDALLLQEINNTKDRFSIFSIFKASEGYFITPILLGLNILIFALMILSGVGIFTPDIQSLVDWGANFRPSTLQGEWWRLLTACFIHIGLFHLLLNMYALVYVGIVLEPYFKSSRFLVVYITTGIFASACSLWWHDYTVSAGASGAIFGLYGVFFALLTTNVLHESVKKSFLTSTAIFIIYNLLNGLKPDSGVDNAAHIGGLLSGLLIGYAMIPSLRKTDNSRLTLNTMILVVVFSIGGCFYLCKSIPNDYGTYDAEMLRFSELEQKSLSVFHLPENTATELILKEINDNGLPGWNENLRIISGIDKLNLPVNLKERNNRLKKYCELRIKHFNLLVRALNENSDHYEKELNESNEAIGSIIAELANQ